MFLPGKFHRQRSLADSVHWVTELDTTEQMTERLILRWIWGMEVGKFGGWLNLGINNLGERLKVVSKIRICKHFL